MNRHLLISTLVLLLNSTVSPAFAQTEVEIEPNNSLAEAKQIVIESLTSIEGYLAPMDRDFFEFYGMPGDIVDVDIDRGIGGTTRVNTYVAIFNQDGIILRANDDSDSIDDGSISVMDSYIEGFVIPKEGYYTIGVTNYSAPFIDGGTTQSTGPRNLQRDTVGDYLLNITYSSFQVKQVAIRVSPGNVRYRPINPRSSGILKVAILSAADFNALQMVIPSSLTFGATGNEQQNARCRGKDVNRDGYKDLVCKFDSRAAGFFSFHEEAILKGKTIDGGAIEGSGYIKIVKHHRGHHEKRHHKRKHHRDDH